MMKGLLELTSSKKSMQIRLNYTYLTPTYLFINPCYSKPNTASDLSTTFIYARLVLKPKFQTTSLKLFT